jgi:hypothetical protein
MWLFRKKRETALEESARLYRAEGMRRANELMDVVKDELLKECFVDPELAKFTAERGPLMQLSFELQFLWVFFTNTFRPKTFRSMVMIASSCT